MKPSFTNASFTFSRWRLEFYSAFFYGSTARADWFQIAHHATKIRSWDWYVNDGHQFSISTLIQHYGDLCCSRAILHRHRSLRKTAFRANIAHLCSPSSCMTVSILAWHSYLLIFPAMVMIHPCGHTSFMHKSDFKLFEFFQLVRQQLISISLTWGHILITFFNQFFYVFNNSSAVFFVPIPGIERMSSMFIRKHSSSELILLSRVSYNSWPIPWIFVIFLISVFFSIEGSNFISGFFSSFAWVGSRIRN